MSDLTMRHVRWAAQECYWQQSGEPSVAWMLEGYQFAAEHVYAPLTPHTYQLLDAEFVLRLAVIVEPRHNVGKWRSVDVRVGYDVKMPHQQVPAAMAQWFRHLVDMDPTEAFRQYEEIHPFRDGNGRTGSILFNILRGTLDKPVHPPNLWDDPRRYEGEIVA